jgi:hypothetical protein
VARAPEEKSDVAIFDRGQQLSPAFLYSRDHVRLFGRKSQTGLNVVLQKAAWIEAEL